MKLKINWKALWNAVKPVLLGAIGGGVIALTDGCSSRVCHFDLAKRRFEPMTTRVWHVSPS